MSEAEKIDYLDHEIIREIIEEAVSALKALKKENQSLNEIRHMGVFWKKHYESTLDMLGFSIEYIKKLETQIKDQLELEEGE